MLVKGPLEIMCQAINTSIFQICIHFASAVSWGILLEFVHIYHRCINVCSLVAHRTDSISSRHVYAKNQTHYSDVIMRSMPTQITCVSIVWSTVCSGADQRKHQSAASLAFARGIHRSPVDSPHKGPVTWKMLPFDDAIMQRWMCVESEQSVGPTS